MRLLLTSGGILNDSIRQSLVALLGKPIEESDVLYVPTALHARPGGPQSVFRSIMGQRPGGFLTVAWRSVGILELTALPSLDRAQWTAAVRAADAVLVDGGDPLFLSHWMRESGFADVLAALPLYVGLSAGGTVLGPRVGEEFVGWRPPGGDDRTLGIVPFAMFPHLDHPDLPTNHMGAAEAWAAKLDCPAYAVDDHTALKVIGGDVEVVSEGAWRHFGR